MIKGLIAALALGMALPAFAEKGDTARDVKDATADKVDDAKDSLATDSGKDKAKRHGEKTVRSANRKARHTKNNVKKDLDIKDKKD
jgi:hypothetical protein